LNSSGSCATSTPIRQIDRALYVDYPDIVHTDNLETPGAFTAALTSAVEHEEFTSRVFAIA